MITALGHIPVGDPGDRIIQGQSVVSTHLWISRRSVLFHLDTISLSSAPCSSKVLPSGSVLLFKAITWYAIVIVAPLVSVKRTVFGVQLKIYLSDRNPYGINFDIACASLGAEASSTDNCCILPFRTRAGYGSAYVGGELMAIRDPLFECFIHIFTTQEIESITEIYGVDNTYPVADRQFLELAVVIRLHTVRSALRILFRERQCDRIIRHGVVSIVGM